MGFLSVFVAVSASKLDCKTIFLWVKNVYIDLFTFPIAQTFGHLNECCSGSRSSTSQSSSKGSCVEYGK